MKKYSSESWKKIREKILNEDVKVDEVNEKWLHMKEYKVGAKNVKALTRNEHDRAQGLLSALENIRRVSNAN